MKLSDIKGERVFDVIADIIDPIANIAADDEVAELFKRKAVPNGENPRIFGINRIRTSVPKLIKNHKGDMITILSTIEGVTPVEYAAALSLGKLVNDFIDLLSDDETLALFTSAQTENSSGSAQENIEAAEASELSSVIAFPQAAEKQSKEHSRSIFPMFSGKRAKTRRN